MKIEIEQLMGQLGFQLESMTGIDLMTIAELVAEIDIHRFPTGDKLARFSGIAPIVVGSGNKSKVSKLTKSCMTSSKALLSVRSPLLALKECRGIPIFMLTIYSGCPRGKQSSKPLYVS
nr:IS110 family transposase [Paenibacillus alvei]